MVLGKGCYSSALRVYTTPTACLPPGSVVRANVSFSLRESISSFIMALAHICDTWTHSFLECLWYKTHSVTAVNTGYNLVITLDIRNIIIQILGTSLLILGHVLWSTPDCEHYTLILSLILRFMSLFLGLTSQFSFDWENTYLFPWKASFDTEMSVCVWCSVTHFVTNLTSLCLWELFLFLYTRPGMQDCFCHNLQRFIFTLCIQFLFVVFVCLTQMLSFFHFPSTFGMSWSQSVDLSHLAY